VDGITLEQYLRKFGQVQPELAVRWAVELTEVLSYLHGLKPPVIYRDLKPANIIIQPDQSLKLIDFGAALVVSYGQQRQQMMMGTPGYSAPEQWQSGMAEKTSDIYGLGAVLHEMLTGISPKQLWVKRRPVREYDKAIPRELEKIIITCTKKRQSERYQSMEQVRQALLGLSRQRKRRDMRFSIKRGIGAALFLLAGIRLFLPFLWGVDAACLPFPYLKEPLLFLLAALLYRSIFLGKGKEERRRKKQEKSIFLTEKKFAGIYISAFFFLVSGLLLAGMKPVQAYEPEGLWVEMRDDRNRKLLLKDGTVYAVSDRVKLEIPAESMPEGEIALQLVASGEDGEIYTSRIFLLEKQDKE
jgi:serine/threonine protein kinase